MANPQYHFGCHAGLAGVESFLLQRQERQLLAESREHMGDGWYLPHFPADKPVRPKVEKQPEPVKPEAGAKPQNENES